MPQSSSSADLTASLLDDARELRGDIAELRHDLHRYPEIGLDLPRTQEKVLAGLDGLGYEITTGANCTSVTAVLRGTKNVPDQHRQADSNDRKEASSAARREPSSGDRQDSVSRLGDRPAVLLRGDMDALPLQERTGLPFASAVEGVMHACGHDLHTSMLVGAAQLLASRRDQLAGDVVLMFQPGEEGYNGAAKMIDDGVLDAAGPRVDAVYAMHVMSSLQPGGTFFSKPGAAMSSSDYLYVTVRGPGGHGSAPHLSPDPIPAAAEMISALQDFVARRINIFDPVVVSVGVLKAGTLPNIIPDEARFEASLRSFSVAAKERMKTEIPRLLKSIAAGRGLDISVDFADGYPATVNDPAEVELVSNSVAELFGAERYHAMADPLTASEDFSRVLNEVPGAMTFLSAVPKDQDFETAAFNHSPSSVFDDDILPDGAALYARLAIDRLAAD